MPIESADLDGELPAPGSRWGSGAQSVLPYLTRTLQAKPFAGGSDPRDVKSRPKPPPESERPVTAS